LPHPGQPDFLQEFPMSRKPSLAAALPAAVLAITFAFGAQAQTGATGTAPGAAAKAPAAAAKSLSGDDRAFVEKAAMGGMAEVELGTLAQQKASSAEVKQFASRMVQDHGQANGELKSIAASKGIQLPAALDRKHKGDVERLGKLGGAEFDRAYMRHMVDDHKKDVAEFKRAAGSAKDADIKGFAAKTLPTLQEHLQLAEKTHDGLKSQVMGSQKPAAGVKKGGC
jgi:putative membrane protein